MKVRVVFYGVLKQDIGIKEQTLEFPQDALAVEELVDCLKQHHPALIPRLPAVAYVVNDEIVAPGYVLRDGDEAGLLPPVSGG